MPQMGPMMWVIFLFIMLILVVSFVTVVHDSELDEFKWEDESSEDWKMKKWW